jgi:hypothetical protein
VKVCHPQTCARFTPAATGTTTQVRHLGISDEEAEQVLALERRRIQTDGGEPPHSVSLIWGWGETET